MRRTAFLVLLGTSAAAASLSCHGAAAAASNTWVPDDAVSLIQRTPAITSFHSRERIRPHTHMTWHVTEPVIVAVNNLAGNGPHERVPTEIRYHNVSTLHSRIASNSTRQEDVLLDLLVTAETNYSWNKNAHKNGALGDFGIIHVAGNSSSTFRFSFVQSGSYMRMVIPEFDFTIFDMDQSEPEQYCQEMLTGWAVKRYAMLPTAYSVVISDQPGEGVTVCSNTSEFGGLVPNPASLSMLTLAQAKAAIMFSFENTSDFLITFTNRALGPRPMIFAGTSWALEPPRGSWHTHFEPISNETMPDAFSTHFFWHVHQPAEVVANNLGGKGPNFDDPPEIRYKTVGVLNTVTAAGEVNQSVILDLVVFTEGPYWGREFANSSLNGAQGDYGRIGLSGNSNASMIFTFVETGTYEPRIVPDFDFTIFDVDNQGNTALGEQYTVHGPHAYSAAADAFTVIKALPGQVQLTSNVKVLDGAIPNPTGDGNLTHEQLRAAVQFRFKNSAVWVVDFNLTTNVPRAFLFSGVAKPDLSEVGITKVVPLKAPASSVVFGDPHVMNIRGEKFDIQRAGIHTFLAIPHGAGRGDASLHMQGQVDEREGPCTGQLFLTRVDIVGLWLGALERLVLSTRTEMFNTPETVGLEVGQSGRISAEQFMVRVPSTTAEVRSFQPARPTLLNKHVTTFSVKLHFGPIAIKVTWEHQKEKIGYSNSLMLLVSGLGQVQGSLSGLLGDDDHFEAASKPPQCLERGESLIEMHHYQRGVRARGQLEQ